MELCVRAEWAGRQYSGPTVDCSSSLKDLLDIFTLQKKKQTKAHVISQRDHPPPLAAGHDTQGTLCVTQIGNEVSSYHYYLASSGPL